jgi:hypothetical protein
VPGLLPGAGVPGAEDPPGAPAAEGASAPELPSAADESDPSSGTTRTLPVGFTDTRGDPPAAPMAT